MRRIAITLALALTTVVACRRETPARQPANPVTRQPTSPSVVGHPSSTTPSVARSTPQKCAGDGSYSAAVDCIRMAATLRFRSSEGEGEMTRKTPGSERMALRAHDGEWIAEVKPSGIVWTQNGKHVTEVPPALERLYQRLAIFPDPQKKEGTPKLSMEGTAKRYDFTDANNGDRCSVWVAPDDGRITKMQVNAWTISFE